MQVDLEQGSDIWKKFRQERIGASDVSAILGISRWCTPYQLWEKKLGLVEEKPAEWYMHRGLELEPEARGLFCQKTGIFVYPKVLIDLDYPFLMASLDGISEDGQTVVEIKCPSKTDHDTALSGEIPEQYYPQLQHQCYVAKVAKVAYCSYNGTDIALVDCYADQDYIDKMIEKELEFYKCMTEFTPPTMTDRDYIKRNDIEWIVASQNYIQVKQRLKDLEQQLEEVRQELLRLSQEKCCIGNGIEVTRRMRKGSIDYKKITDLLNIDAEKFRKEPQASWNIRIC